MGKIRIGTVFLIVLLACLAGGCGKKDYNKMVENHAAVKTYRDGVWGVRYYSASNQSSGERITDTTVQLSVDVKKDMDKKQMLEIMDYYERTRNAWFEDSADDSVYKGELDADYTCYAVFYRGDTDEEICRIKYFNGEETEPSREEASAFPMAALRNEDGEREVP